MKNILSIDFDYFQSVTEQQVVGLYPDGLDLPTGISTIVWAQHFANPKCEAELLKIKAPQQKLQVLRGCLRKQHSTTPVMMVNSHIHIFNFIKGLFNTNEELNVVNIDMHHDIANDNSNLDCGNWVSQLKKVYPRVNLTWIQNPVSAKMFPVPKGFKCLETTDLTTIRNYKYDAIFLCRSDNWLCPTLDADFTDLYFTIAAKFKNVQVERGIERPRDIMTQALEVRKQTEIFMQRQAEKQQVTASKSRKSANRQKPS